ncbi:hypothetical protein N9W44_07515, partial [Alphaproteobacteria bacterium]|nr:hypothetical protein [Alphaproteobacteria bacterium]
MRSFISNFRVLIIAISAIALFETGYYYLTGRPSLIDRANFVPLNVQTYYTISAERYVLWEKMRRDLAGSSPDFVQVGDSSGYFNIIPDIVEEHLPNKKYLNWSCCGVQGYHGYLALLEFAFRKYPSIRYSVIYTALSDGNIGLISSQWKQGPRNLFISGIPALEMMGKEMERDVASIWRFAALPSFEWRLPIVRSVFSGGEYIPPRWEKPGQNLISYTGNTHIRGVLKNLEIRQGHSVEEDIQNLKYQPTRIPCNNMRQDSFWDWRSLEERTYTNAFLEAYTKLAEEYNVTPIWAMHVTPCDGGTVAQQYREEIEKAAEQYGVFVVPFAPTDYVSPDLFSGSVHLSRDYALDNSTRLGNALGHFISNEEGVSNQLYFHSKRTPTTPVKNINLLAFERQYVSGIRWDECDAPEDFTKFAKPICDGKTSCSVPLKSLVKPDMPQNCRSIYRLTYQCGDMPVRSLRQEGDYPEIGESFRISVDCGAQIAYQNIAEGRINIFSASYGAECNGSRYNHFTPTKKYCDGKTECEFKVIKPQGISNQCNKPSMKVSYYCGNDPKLKIKNWEHVEVGAVLGIK